MSANKTIIPDQREKMIREQIETKESLKYRSMAARQKAIAAFVVIIPFIFFIYTVYYTIWVGAPAFYVWLWLVMHFFGMSGISLGFHRLASHASFKPHKFIKMFFLILGSASAQGPVIYWASNP